MKLLSLQLKGKYKGLNNQTFDFTEAQGEVIAFIGLNGSGKSQLLELIGECFAYLERLQRSDFKNKAHLGFDFILTYSLKGYVNLAPFANMKVFGQKLRVEGGFTDPTFTVEVNYGHVEQINVHPTNESLSIEELPLPNVVGYSSGLNENLQRPFLKNSYQLVKALNARARYHKERRKVRLEYELSRYDSETSYDIFLRDRHKLYDKYHRNHPYLFNLDAIDYEDEVLNLPESTTHSSKLIYLDYDSAQLAIAFINFKSALFSDDKVKTTSDALELNYSNPTLLSLDFDFTQSGVVDELIDDVKTLMRLTESDNGYVDFAGAKTSDFEYEYYELESLKGRITLNLKRINEESQANPLLSPDAFRLFQRLYKVQQLSIKKISPKERLSLERDMFFGTVKKPLKVKLPLMVNNLALEGTRCEAIAYEELSDGESQMLQVLSIIKLYSNENTLFLLDEPETHLNPAWRTSYHNFLMKALGSDARSQVLVSTHSPFMVSSLRRKSVFQFSRSKNGSIEMKEVQKETYGASFEVLVKDFFELRSLISQSVIDEIREQLKHGDSQTKEWIEENLGRSAERAYLLRKLSH